jgi:hypothetical protein
MRHLGRRAFSAFCLTFVFSRKTSYPLSSRAQRLPATAVLLSGSEHLWSATGLVPRAGLTRLPRRLGQLGGLHHLAAAARSSIMLANHPRVLPARTTAALLR